MSYIDTLRDERIAMLKTVRDVSAKAEARGGGFTADERAQVDDLLAKAEAKNAEIKRFKGMRETSEMVNAALDGDGPRAKASGFKASPLGQRIAAALRGDQRKADGLTWSWDDHNADAGNGRDRRNMDADGYDIARDAKAVVSTSGRRTARLMGADGAEVFRLPESGTPILAAVTRVEIGEQPGSKYFFTRQTTRDDNPAAFVEHKTGKPSTSFNFETIEDRYRTVAVLSDPIAVQDLSDIPSLRDEVGDELARRVLRRIEWAILLGDEDTATEGDDQFNGLANITGVRQQAFVDTALGTIRRAIGALEGDGYTASAIMLNPADWTDIELSMDSVGRPIFASRWQDRPAASLFGVPVHVSPLVTAGQAVIGDWSAYLLTVREDIVLSWSDAGDDFTNNTVRFRAEARVGGNALYPAAFAFADLTSE